MNILLLGSGGRECALAAKIAQSPECTHLYIAPGNGGTGLYGINLPLKPTDFPAIEAAVSRYNIDMIVVGNEDPLVEGIRNYMDSRMPEVLIVGPDRAGAKLEGSKRFAKEFMQRHGIPTARYRSFTAATASEACDFLDTLTPPYVLKADGLAAGKGVVILSDKEAAKAELDEMFAGKFGDASATVVIEEFLSGIECSVFVLTDGTGAYHLLPVAKDYKRIGEGDTGLNTGGMGAVSPVPFADSEFMKKVEERIVLPTLAGLHKEGIDYRGFIFLGLINVGGSPYVIEYNVRMGDPETEVVMPRIASDIVALLKAAASGTLSGTTLDIDTRTAVTVMLVSGGYPEAYKKGYPITGDLTPPESIIYHAGTSLSPESELLTSGGRVMAVTSLGSDIAEARAKSYKAIKNIHFRDMYCRRDIGTDLMKYNS